VPYGRKSTKFLKSYAIVGSVNRDTFLIDPTGDRRFPVIALPDGWEIPIERLREERDEFAAATRGNLWYRRRSPSYLS
jgi:predicted P-loop ATPase